MRKTLLIVLTFVIMVSAFSSCSSDGKNILTFNDNNSASVEVSSDGDTSAISIDGTNISYTEGQFHAFYILQKDNFIAYNKYAESLGYVVTEDGTAVGDTEEFWAAGCGVKDDNGNDLSYGEYFFDYCIESFESFVAKKIIAEKNSIAFDDDFYADLNVLIAQDISANSIVDEETEIIDENGNIPSWILDRWEMHLASNGLDRDIWVEFNYTFSKIDEYLIDKLEDLGVIKTMTEDEAKKELAVSIDYSIKEFLNSNIKFKYLAYRYHTEKDYESSETSDEEDSSNETSDEEDSSNETSDVENSSEESSEEISDDSSEETSEAELTPKEKSEKYNDELDAKCEAIYEALKADPSKFDEEMAKCDVADELIPNYQDGMTTTPEYYEELFNSKSSDYDIGDIVMHKTKEGVHILMFVEITEADSGISRTPTEEDINKFIATEINNSFYELVSGYTDAISLSSDVIDGYKIPWKV